MLCRKCVKSISMEEYDRNHGKCNECAKRLKKRKRVKKNGK